MEVPAEGGASECVPVSKTFIAQFLQDVHVYVSEELKSKRGFRGVRAAGLELSLIHI